MNRRTFITTTATAAAGSLIVPATSHAALGLTQAPLAYAPEALEPHIDAMTMTIHHGNHHAAYIKNLGDALNAASIGKTDAVEIISDLSAMPEAQRMLIRNNGGGHVTD